MLVCESSNTTARVLYKWSNTKKLRLLLMVAVMQSTKRCDALFGLFPVPFEKNSITSRVWLWSLAIRIVFVSLVKRVEWRSESECSNSDGGGGGGEKRSVWWEGCVTGFRMVWSEAKDFSYYGWSEHITLYHWLSGFLANPTAITLDTPSTPTHSDLHFFTFHLENPRYWHFIWFDHTNLYNKIIREHHKW